MILRSVRVEGFRCFASPVEVAGFSEGLNLIAASNGSGKSTLFEAVRRALIDHHAVSGKEAERMRPWGRSLAPTITVDFAHQAEEWRLFKRFLDTPECALWRRENDAWVAVDRGEKADERVRLLLERSQASRGLAKETHWGLAQILWAPQGAIELPPLEQSLATRMRESLAAQVAGERGAKLEAAVQKRYATYYTPQTGKLRTGKRASELVRADDERKTLVTEIQSAKDAYERWQGSSERVDSLRNELQNASQKERTLLAHCVDRENAVAAFESKERATLEAEKRLQEAASQLRATKAVVATWTQALQALEHSRSALVALEAPREQLQQQLAKAQREENLATQLLTEREELEAQWVAANQKATAKKLAVQARERVAHWQTQAQELLDATLAVATAQTLLDSVQQVSVEWVGRAQKGHSVLVRSDAVLATARVSVSVEAHRAITVSEQKDGVETALVHGEKHEWVHTPSVTLVLDGVATITAQVASHSSAVREAIAQRESAEQVLAECRARFGTDVAEELSAKQHDYERKRTDLLQAKDRLAQLRKRTGTDQELADTLAAAREELSLLSDAESDVVDLEPLRVQREQLASLREMQSDKERLTRERHKIESKIAAEDERLVQENHRFAQAEERLRLLRAESPQTELSSLQREQEDAMLAYDGARLSLERLKRESGEKAPLLAKLEDARRTHKEQLAKVQAIRDELRLEEGRLEEQSRGASFARLARAEERLSLVDAESAKLKLEADAVRLLYETLTQAREAAVSKVVVDVERRAAQIIEQITDDSRRKNVRVVLGDAFEPLGAQIEDETGSVGLESLSGGENEQVHFAVRLALAEVLAKEQRVMLVLDDVMVATDQRRMQRVIKLLEDASERMQIVVLTCHPERYESATNARRLALT